MGDQQNISQILAALAAAQPGGQAGGFAGSMPASMPTDDASGYPLPPPDNTGKFDISGVGPVTTGSVNIQDAISRARGFAAEKGLAPNAGRGIPHDEDGLRNPRSYRRSRSPSRSPTRPRRDVFRDNYNPYREERRGDARPGNDRGYMRERSFSPQRPGRRRTDTYRDGNDHSPPERRIQGGDDNSETLAIDSRLVGLIIGRQGETLRGVEAETETRIQFLDCPEPQTRLCKITGNKMARDYAKDEINRLVRENSTSSRPPVGLTEWPPRNSGATAQHSGGEKSLQIMVPDRTVGLIIGRGGETIQDLQERSGCHVNIKDKSMNGLRPVNLTGPARAAERAKSLIMEIVDSDSRNSANSHQQQQYPPSRDTRGHGYGGGGDSYGGASAKVTDSFFVPKDAVGMIIGKGGEAIKEMQAVTGCKVNILPPSGPDGEREVTLQGSRTAIDQATQSIMEKVDALQQNRSQPPRRDDHDDDRYPTYQSQSYSKGPGGSSQRPPPQTGAGDSNDPYAIYGGYDNYMAMWYAALAQQQQYQQQYQQSGQEPPPRDENSGPPGLA